MKWTCKFERKKGQWIFVPSVTSRLEGYKLKDMLEKRWSIPSYYFHLISGGHVMAVQSHIKHKYFSRLDIAEFYNSINKSRLTRHLKKYMNYDSARSFADKSVVVNPDSPKNTRNYILPFGFVQSPILASICLFHSKVGSEIRKVHRRNMVSLSVYMDDIVLSSDSFKELKYETERIVSSFDDSGFKLNESKSAGPAEMISAFNIDIRTNLLHFTDQRIIEFNEKLSTKISNHAKTCIHRYIKSVNPEDLKRLNCRPSFKNASY